MIEALTVRAALERHDGRAAEAHFWAALERAEKFDQYGAAWFVAEVVTELVDAGCAMTWKAAERFASTVARAARLCVARRSLCGAARPRAAGSFDDGSRPMTRFLSPEAQLAEAQRIARIGSWEWDRNTDTVTCSLEMRRMLSIDADCDRITGDEFWRASIRRTSSERRDALAHAEHAHGPCTIDHLVLAAKGAPLHVHTRVQPYGDSIERFLVGTTQDIKQRPARHWNSSSTPTRKKWKPSAASRVAWRTTSTISSPASPATPSCCSMARR